MVSGPYLLDTATLLWTMGASKRLSNNCRRALKAGPLVLSVVSFWEVVIKARKGALDISDPVNWWARASDYTGGDVLSIRASHVSALAGLPTLHKDPFDRMLIAQAAAEGFALITSDEQVQKYSIKTIW